MVSDWSLTSLNALIVTEWVGIPDMTPVDELRERPVGSDPDVIENKSSSPLTVGVVENGLLFDRT